MNERLLQAWLAALCLGTLLLCSLAGCSRGGEKAEVAPQAAKTGADRTAVIATIPDEDQPPQAIAGHAGETAQNQPASFQVVFSPSGRGVAYLTAKGDRVQVVHNQSRGNEYAAVAAIVLSPDGRRAAYPAQVGKKWRMVVDGREGKEYDTLLTPVFSPDGRHLAYQAKEGDKWYMVVDDKANAGTTASYTTPEFSGDSTSLAFVEAAANNSEMRLIVSDLSFGRQSVTKSISDQLFTVNSKGTRIAAVQLVDGRLRVIDFGFARPEAVHQGPLYEVIERVSVSDKGDVAYCALKDKKRLMVLNDREEALPKGVLPELPVIRPDGKGVGAFLGSQGTVFLHQAFAGGADKGKHYPEAAHLAYSGDGRHYAYAAREGASWFVVVDGKEGPRYDRVVTPTYSPDGKFLVYRARHQGKRFVVVADPSGKTIRQHPAYEQVFEVRFSADGKSVVYGVKDGRKLINKVEPL